MGKGMGREGKVKGEGRGEGEGRGGREKGEGRRKKEVWGFLLVIMLYFFVANHKIKNILNHRKKREKGRRRERYPSKNVILVSKVFVKYPIIRSSSGRYVSDIFDSPTPRFEALFYA
jgi:hypothetical protein